MKKFLLVLFALMVIGLTACSSNDDAKTEKKDVKEAEVAPKVDVKKELVIFYMDLGKKINAKDADLNAYVKKASKPDAKPEELPTADEKIKASESAAAVAAELNKLQVPEELKDQKADLEAALKDFVDSYIAMADELKKDAPVLEAADETFIQAEQKLGPIFESVKLFAPSLSKQVN